MFSTVYQINKAVFLIDYLNINVYFGNAKMVDFGMKCKFK